MKNTTETREVKVRGFGTTEDKAFESALREADKKYEIFDSVNIRKVRGETAWDVTFRVIVR